MTTESTTANVNTTFCAKSAAAPLFCGSSGSSGFSGSFGSSGFTGSTYALPVPAGVFARLFNAALASPLGVNNPVKPNKVGDPLMLSLNAFHFAFTSERVKLETWPQPNVILREIAMEVWSPEVIKLTSETASAVVLMLINAAKLSRSWSCKKLKALDKSVGSGAVLPFCARCAATLSNVAWVKPLKVMEVCKELHWHTLPEYPAGQIQEVQLASAFPP